MVSTTFVLLSRCGKVTGCCAGASHVQLAESWLLRLLLAAAEQHLRDSWEHPALDPHPLAFLPQPPKVISHHRAM